MSAHTAPVCVTIVIKTWLLQAEELGTVPWAEVQQSEVQAMMSANPGNDTACCKFYDGTTKLNFDDCPLEPMPQL